jgi:hypothetical protein
MTDKSRWRPLVFRVCRFWEGKEILSDGVPGKNVAGVQA